ncbi:MAG: galactose-1-phosphate uridylyltransferase [Thermoleophilaceae bacterium]
MPELRIDPLSGLRVIVAGDRGGRPGAWLDVEPRAPIDAEEDPFAAGHEDRTPPEVYSLPGGNGRWRVRVVPNMYPALSPREAGAGADPLESGRGEPDLFAARPAQGAHEVIVNAPDPVHSLAELERGQVQAALGVWRERMRAHADAAYVHVIVNEGKEAGASLPHTHAQLYALPFVPAAVARERERFTAYSDRTQGRNLLEDLLQEEVRRRERVVSLDDEAVALCPFGARVPFHMQVVPRRPAARFSDDGPLGAGMLREALSRLGAVLGALPPLNIWIRTAPRDAERFCWRMEVMPRLAQLAGLEIGTGVHLNVLAPEDAAERLRGASL